MIADFKGNNPSIIALLQVFCLEEKLYDVHVCLPSRTPEEELRDKIAELERRNLDLQMENDLLKKVRELERRGRYL